MSLTFYYHPLASFCHKVLIALYESGTPFEARIVDLMDDDDAARFFELWPVGKIPVLRDEARDRTVPETTIIIEYLEQYYPGARPHTQSRWEADPWIIRPHCNHAGAIAASDCDPDRRSRPGAGRSQGFHLRQRRRARRTSPNRASYGS